MADIERVRAARQELIVARATAEDISNSKAMSFGGAGAALAMILLIAQIGVAKPLLVWSLGLAATALPLWIALALSYDAWGILKLGITDLFALRWLYWMQNYTFCGCVALMFGSVACLLYAIEPVTAIFFGVFSIIGFVIVCSAVFGAMYRLRHRSE